MPVYIIKISSSARKSMRKIPLLHQQRIFRALSWLERNPLLGEKMRGDYKNCYKVKVWPYRIIYTLKRSQLIIDVIEIDHRGNISYA